MCYLAASVGHKSRTLWCLYGFAPGLTGLKSRCRLGSHSPGVLTRERSASKLLWAVSCDCLTEAPPSLWTGMEALLSVWRLPAVPPTPHQHGSLSLRAAEDSSPTWGFLFQAPSYQWLTWLRQAHGGSLSFDELKGK